MASLWGIGIGVLDRFPKLRFVDRRFPFAWEPIANRLKLSAAAKRKILNDNARRLYSLDRNEAIMRSKPHRMLAIFSTLVPSVLFVLCLARAENIKIGIPSLTVTMLPLAVAKEQGFFQKESLNAEIVLMPASLNIKVLLAGDIQYATTITSGVVANIRGINTRVVMCFVDRVLLDLVGNSEIGSIADLKGKLIGISSRGGLHDVVMRRIFAQSGMDASQATFITVGGPGGMFGAIQSKRIAAGLLNPPHNFLAYREGLKNLGFAGNFVRSPSTGIVTMRETLERSPDQVRRLLRALTRARAFAKDNKPATLAILKRFVRISDDELAGKIYDYHKRAETPDGKVDAVIAADTIRDSLQAEAITKEMPIGQVFDFSYLPPR